MIFYLCQAYQKDPFAAFKDAVRWVYLLRLKRHVDVLSPVLHTHHYDLELMRTTQDQLGDEEFEQLKADQIMYRRHEDYVAWDLALAEGWLVNGGNCNDHDCTGCDYWNERGVPGHCEIDKYHQPNLTMLFAPTCCHQEDPAENGETVHWEWDSKGAKAEYDWAQQHHVRCLLLEPFLEGTEVEIKCR